MGADETRAEEIWDAFALGSEVFRAGVRKLVKAGREVAKPSGLRRRLKWTDLVSLVGQALGESSLTFMDRRGSFGKPLALWAARRYGGMTLREAGVAANGMDYTAVSMSVKRLEIRAKKRQGTLSNNDEVKT